MAKMAKQSRRPWQITCIATEPATVQAAGIYKWEKKGEYVQHNNLPVREL